MVQVAAKTWEPTKTQWDFINRQEFEVLFGGAKYGAKTDGLLAYAITRRQTYPGSKGLFIRRELSEITKEGAAWDRIQDILGNGVRYNQTDHKVYFPNGSVEEFGHCKDESDKFHYQGAQYDDICFDQLEQFTESQYLYILGACRTAQGNPPKDSEGAIIQPRIRCTANPGDVGHSWVKARFIDVSPARVAYKASVRIKTPVGETVISRERVFLPSYIWDNPFASPEYMAQLEAMGEPYRSAYLYGLWDVFVGQAFPDFHPMTDSGPYHVIPTDELPRFWRRYEGHDWGHNAPQYTCWGAIDPEGGIIIYKELWGRGWDPAEIAQRIIDTRGADSIAVTWAGHDIFAEHRARMTQEQERALEDKGLMQASIIAQYRKAGLLTCQLPTSLDRLARKQKVHEFLKPRDDDVPYLRIMDCCPVLIKTLQQIPIDSHRTEDVQTDFAPDADVRDDPYDALGYLLMSVGSKLVKRSSEPVPKQYKWVTGR